MSDLPVLTPYDRIGGEEGLRRFTQRFYELMDSLPEAEECRAIHPPSLAMAEQKLFEYLSGWLGGPPLFTDKYGAPMLRRRHLHAPIAGPEIEGWLACFRRAWAETVEDQELGAMVLPQVEGLARHMRNREDPAWTPSPYQPPAARNWPARPGPTAPPGSAGRGAAASPR